MDLKAINLILQNPSWDVIAIFVFIAIGFFYGIYAGKEKLIALLFSLYVSGFLFDNFYYLDRLIKNKNALLDIFLLRGIIFIALVVILFILFSKIVAGSHAGGVDAWWKTLILSFMASGLLFSYIFHLFPSREIFTFSPMIKSLFASDNAFFWWITLPLVALFWFR